MQYIDLYGHYTWNLGGDEMTGRDEAKMLLKLAQQDHIIKAVAVPRLVCGKHSPEEIYDYSKKVEQVRLLSRKFSVKLYEGSELLLNRHLITAMEKHLFLPIQDTHILIVTMDRLDQYEDYEKELLLYLKAIINHSYKPLFKDIERLVYNTNDLSFIREIADMGCILGICAPSLLGYRGKQLKLNAEALLDAKLVHVIGSDASYPNADGMPCLNEAYAYLSKNYDYETTAILLNKNPQRVLNEEDMLMIHGRMPKQLERLSMKLDRLSKSFNIF